MQYEIRQLGISGILDHTIRLVKNNLGLFLVMSVPMMIPLAIFETINRLAAAQQLTGIPPLVLLGGVGVAGLLMLVTLPLTHAALVHAAARAYLQRPITAGQAFQLALPRIVPLIWTWIISTLAIMGGLILCIIPGIMATLAFYLSTEIVVLEGTNGVPALSRSRALMKDNWVKLFVVLFVVGLINASVSVIASVVPQVYVQIVLGTIAQAITQLLGMSLGVVFYFSARCQHENFDLVLLADSVQASDEPISEPAG